MSARPTSAQLRGARGMLDWSMLDLAKASNVSISTVKRMEKGEDRLLSDGIRSVVQSALERAGVHFLEDDGGGAGLRLRLGGAHR